MYLADREIRSRLSELNIMTDSEHEFDPDQQIQPCSIDLRLSPVLWRPKGLPRGVTLDLTRNKLLEVSPRRNWRQLNLSDGGTIVLKPGEIALCRVYEEVTIPPDCAGMIEGRSSFARMGLSVHCTGSFINPGWRGHMPLTLINNGPWRLRIPPYLAICQLALVKLSEKPDRVYGEPSLKNKYMNDDGGPSYWWRDKTVRNLLNTLGQPDLQPDIQEKLLDRIGIPEDEILARLEKLIANRPVGTYGNVDDLLQDFAELEDRTRMRDSILRFYGQGAPLLLLGGTIGSLFVHPISFLHIIIWTLLVVSLPAAYVAWRNAPREYLGKRELARVEKKGATA